jgi:mannan endo-1,4-beta-mannosidase
MHIELGKQLIITALIAVLSFQSKAQGTIYEAENAQLTGTSVATSHKGFSGTGYVTGFDNDGDKAVFKFTPAKEGNYQLYICYSAPNGTKNNTVYVNDTNQGSIVFTSNSKFKELIIGKIWLNAGENTITILKDWGWFELDYIRIDSELQATAWNISKNPVNSNASAETKSLLAFLVDNFGKTTLAGQFQNDNLTYTASSSEISYIEKTSGKYPAIYGTDLINYSPSRVSRGVSTIATEDAIKWSKNENGILSLMWHWNAPTDLIDSGEHLWWSGFYSNATTFDIAAVMSDTTSERYQLLLSDIDAIAVQLKKVQNENIPVLWRPLHEAEGAWFWWGAKGPEACKKLWILLYNRLTNYHKINNLLWVWTTSDSDAALSWYPGDEYVDILSVDVYYANGEYGTSSFMFDNLRNKFNGKKLLAMSENGPIPDVDKMYQQDAYWSYFCTWTGDYTTNGIANTIGHIDEVFNSENVTTLDELLPTWNTYVGDKTIRSDNSDVKIFPVPFSGELNINFEGKTPDKITVFNSTGQAVTTINNQSLTENNHLNMSQLPAGIYLISIDSKTGTRSFKIMKE